MKIGLMNGGGYRNWGDDAQLCNTILKLKEMGNNDLVIFSRAGYIKSLTGVDIFDSSHSIFKNTNSEEELLNKYYHIIKNVNNITNLNKTEQTFINNLSKIDTLHFCGSGVINTRHLKGLCIFLLPIILAKKLGKKVILTGQGIGPITNKEWTKLIPEALSPVDVITVRDFDSGVSDLYTLEVKSPIFKAVDDAFGYKITTNRFDYLKGKKVIGINVSAYANEKLIELFYQFAVTMKKDGFYPIFNHFQNEIDLLKKCSKKEFEIVEFNNPSEISEFYSKCSLSVGMRYHSLIFALSHKVPTINLYVNDYQENKIRAIENDTSTNLGMNIKKNIPSVEELVDRIKKVTPISDKKYEEWYSKRTSMYEL